MNRRPQFPVFLIFALFFTACDKVVLPDLPAEKWAQRVPNPRLSGGWVTDAVGLLRPETRDEMNRQIADLEAKTGVEIAVVIVPDAGPLTPMDARHALFKHWGIGKKGKNNGVLILHVTGKRRIEIETGYGVEGVLPDLLCKILIDNGAVPYFKADRFNDGHLSLLRLVIRAVTEPQVGNQSYVKPAEKAAIAADLARKAPGDTAVKGPDAVAYERSEEAYDEEKKTFQKEYRQSHDAAGLARIFLYQMIALGLLGLSFVIWLVYQALALTRQHPMDRYQYLLSGGNKILHWSARSSFMAGAVAWAAYAKSAQWFILGGAAAFAIWVLPFFVTEFNRGFSSRRLMRLRKSPRPCPQCGKTLRLLSEQEDDAFLKPGQVAEEQIDSADYDVWVCICGCTRMERFLGPNPKDECPECHYLTQSHTRTVRVAATEAAPGEAVLTFVCFNCQHRYERVEVLPRIPPPSSSSSDSTSSSSSSDSSSSDSGSFGGGDSGGGGAGSDY